jgi:hypothetical protein
MNNFFCGVLTTTFLLGISSIHAIDGFGPFIEEHRPSFKAKDPNNGDPDNEDHDKRPPSHMVVPPVVMWDGIEVVTVTLTQEKPGKKQREQEQARPESAIKGRMANRSEQRLNSHL